MVLKCQLLNFSLIARCILRIPQNSKDWERSERLGISVHPFLPEVAAVLVPDYRRYSQFEVLKVVIDILLPLGLVQICRRCNGSGRHSFNPWDGDLCYGCGGHRGWLPTSKAGVAKVRRFLATKGGVK